MMDIHIDNKHFTDIQSGRERLVLEDIHIRLQPGEFLALVGPSGCGKSTLLHIVAGLDDAFTGQITWPDESAIDRARLGYVFQNPRLLPWINVRDNISLVLDDPSRHSQQIDALLEATGLTEFSHFHPARLSVGMQRRVALARAFAVRPTLLIMDEPFVSLDDPTACQLRQLLVKVWDARRTTVIFVTHNLREATMLADRILFLSTSPARIIGESQVGIPREKRTKEKVVESRYLELKQLFNSLYLLDSDTG
ncbi:MAG: ABC transporter ATP-binding protein [Gammaproteobacteria bacterium]|nr:ABC transporter ATP-binding protein [Gammaproteobacteria bacterium]